MNTKVDGIENRGTLDNTSFCRINPAVRSSANGIALIITLSILVLVTIVVVAFVTVVRLEGTSARSNFENQRAKAFALMAVDDITATLVDNIPVNTSGTAGSTWAVGPGQLYVTAAAGSSATQTGTSFPLHSGIGGSPALGNAVALNAPSLSTANIYPIAPQNTTNYSATSTPNPTPNPMVVNWINVLQNGARTSGTVALTGTNPVVGRYAYWTDVETCKVNLNTAGRGNVQPVQPSDTQEYGGMPSRVDLSYLDPYPGSPITEQQSQATYSYTAGVSASSGATLNPAFPPSPSSAQHRYNSIAEWANTSSLNTTNAGSGVAAVSASQVTANQFYLTTQARAPELNPWGINKVWWDNYPPENITYSGSNGNFVNSPLYGQGGLLEYPSPYDNGSYADYRYYVYPWAYGGGAPVLGDYWFGFGAADTQTITGTSPFQLPFQNFSTLAPPSAGNELFFPKSTSPAHVNFDGAFDAFFLSLYNQLARSDWPGMPAGQSFVKKYGVAACENIAVNMMFMMDSTIGSATDNIGKCMNYRRSGSAGTWGNNIKLQRDSLGIYGLYLWDSPLGTIDPTTGEVRKLWGNGPWPYVVETSLSLVPTTYPNNASSGAGGNYATINGFVGATGTANGTTQMNMFVYPYVRAVWPKGMFGDNSSAFTYDGVVNDLRRYEIKLSQFYCTATYTDTNGVLTTSTFNRLYPNDPVLAASGTLGAIGYGYIPTTNVGTNWSNPDSLGNSYANFLLEPGAGWPIIIGPFPTTGSISLTFSFRIATCGQGGTFGLEPFPFQNIPTTSIANPANPPGPGEALTLTGTVSNWGQNGDVALSKVVVDPRVCQSASNWITYSDPNPASPVSYETSVPYGAPYGSHNQSNPGMDSSKFAWPPILNMVENLKSTKSYMYQNGASVTAMPGLGWLSLISTADYYKYIPSNPANSGTDQNWLTLDFGPAYNASQLPDWLLMEIFAMAYDQSYCSQTEGKINPNASVYPFSSANSNFSRLAPLEALIGTGVNATSDPDFVSAVPSSLRLSGSWIAQNIANSTLGNSASGSGAVTFPNLPSNYYIYSGQICQIKGVSDGYVNPSVTSGTSLSQFDREALIRDIGGLITTQSSDFKVHVVAQSVKQLSNDLNPNDLKVLAEQQLEADLERTVDLGPDGVPGTADDNIMMDGTTPIPRYIVTISGSTSTPLTYGLGGGTDPLLIGGAGQPPFRYQVSSFKYLNQ